MMIAQNENIHAYIPQRPPMVMIDKLLESNGETTKTSLTIQADNVFVENGLFTAPGLVENIAQTVAAKAGHHAISNQIAIPLGYIAGVKSLKVYTEPRIGTELITSVKVLHEVRNIGVIEGEVRQGEHLIARCEMKIFIRK